MTDPAVQVALDILTDWENKVIAPEGGRGSVPENLAAYQHQFLYEQFDKDFADGANLRKRYHDIKVKPLFMLDEKLRAQSEGQIICLVAVHQTPAADVNLVADSSDNNQSTLEYSTITARTPSVNPGLQTVDAMLKKWETEMAAYVFSQGSFPGKITPKQRRRIDRLLGGDYETAEILALRRRFAEIKRVFAWHDIASPKRAKNKTHD
ncbi:hypothetical protein DM02DRAFT_625283 [Periconia macrospinosa]|uniref:Uncharacterized protein n=1 Tax=Periconia macrospinosa TaxID=97972 RepID=A0A2V1E433_9PLEO|nr:hypothetical protein DM02DRAFT_625283 [Periconia macrospinosa]